MGDGAVGKSLLMLQLAIACSIDTPWIGIEVNQGPVIYFNAEDDIDEITIRLNEICDADETDLSRAWQLNILPMAGQETVLCFADHGVVKPTEVYRRLCLTVEEVQPVLLIIDNLADVYGGDENSRTQVKQFINLLRNICIKYDTTIILIGHPSASGRSSGSGESGSTGWNNSVRVRPYLQKVKDDDDGNERVLEIMKANYSKPQARFELKWAKGRFVRSDARTAFSRIGLDTVDRIIARFDNQFYRVSSQATNWGGYAVAEVLGWDVGKGIKIIKHLTNEQSRNRQDISQYLSTWVTNKALFVITIPDAYRKPVEVFTTKQEETIL